MPSQLTHQVFVEEALSQAEIPLDRETSTWLVLGAQGPDIFYHNQRRMPSGLSYGTLAHRRGYGRLCGAMYLHAAERGLGVDSWAFAYVLGFASHAVLDRHTHPFINYWAGWVDPARPETKVLRGMHPFLERLIDVAVLERYRGTRPAEFGFFRQVDCGDTPPEGLVQMLCQALRATYPEAEADQELASRVRNAYLDTLGFYRATDRVDEAYLREGLRREERAETSPLWLSLLHPPVLPRDLDVMNEAHRTWCHPCNDQEVRHESFWDLFDLALPAMVTLVQVLRERWVLDRDPAGLAENAAALAATVGDFNLSDGRPSTRPCVKRHCGPLPLRELQQEIRRAIIAGSSG